MFVARVLHNYQKTFGIVQFDNGRTFRTASQSVDDEKVFLYLWSEELQDYWDRQCEVDKIEYWVKAVASRHIFAFLECVGEERGVPVAKYRHKSLRGFALHDIRRNLKFLSLAGLRRLRSLAED